MSDRIAAAPCCICQGSDGTLYWAAWCPRCEERDIHTAIAGNHRVDCAECSVCGTTVEVAFKADPAG